MTDLFGNETREPRASLRPLPPPVKLDLFAYASERLALDTGRALSQERAELVAPAGDGLRCLCDRPLRPNTAGRLACEIHD